MCQIKHGNVPWLREFAEENFGFFRDILKISNGKLTAIENGNVSLIYP